MKFLRKLLLTSFVSVWIFLFGFASAFADTIVFTALTGDTDSTFGMIPANPSCQVQSFQLPSNGQVDSLTAYFKRNSTPSDDIEVTINDDSGGNIGTEISSATILTSGLSTSFTEQVATFTANTLTANTTYWLVFGRTGSNDNSNNYAANYRSGNPYPDGTGGAVVVSPCTVVSSEGKDLQGFLTYTPEEIPPTPPIATTTVQVVYNPSETLFQGMILLLMSFGFIAFYFKKQ